MTYINPHTTMFAGYDDMITVAELSTMLKIGRNTAYELVRAGVIPSVRIGCRQIRVSKQTVIEYILRSETADI